MRKLSILIALVALPSVADAKRTKNRDPRLTWVDDEPMKPSASEAARASRDPSASSGTRMAGTIRAPDVARVSVGGEAVARLPSASVPVRREEGAASGETLNELVARQMRKNQPSIDVCTAEAVRRHPTANGTVALRVVVSEKKVMSVHVVSDTVRDIELDACLVKAGQSWKLQLASAHFHWPVTLSPSASR